MMTEQETLAIAINLARGLVLMPHDEIPARKLTALGRALQLLPESPRPEAPLFFSPWSREIWISDRAEKEGPFTMVRRLYHAPADPPARRRCCASGLRRLEAERETLVRALVRELARRVRLLSDPALCRRFEVEIEGGLAAFKVMES